MTLWRWLQIPRTHAALHTTDPIPHPEYLLIWGGSSVTAQFAIQIAARSGVKVIAVASSKTAALVESLGAAHVIVRDSKSGEKIVNEIRGIAGDDITRAIDLVGTETAQHCLSALSTEKDVYICALGNDLR
jgi:NADPH:quinone reductase-like Zn-dependent oxidoreductase